MPFARFYPILDTSVLDVCGIDAIDAAAALLDAGVRMLQLRHKGQYTRARFDEAKAIARLSREAGATFVVNDRADVARLVDAGLHVGQDDLPPLDARRLVGDSRTLGCSTHNEAQLRQASEQPIDYAAFGPVFATSSKANPDPVAGLDELRRMRAITLLPLVAIGGIARSTALAVLAAGADSVAVIGDMYPAPLTLAALKARALEWMALTNSSAG